MLAYCPLSFGYVQGYTHDYICHGTTTLFAALDIATGRVIAQCKKRHRHQDFLSFLRLIDREVPIDLAIHLVVDNYAIHRHANVEACSHKLSYRNRAPSLPTQLILPDRPSTPSSRARGEMA